MVKRERSKSAAPRAKATKMARKTRSLAVLPDNQTVVMRYVSNLTLSSGVVTYTEHTFRGNSIFDPDFTGVGHQPMGHDEWSVLFGRYRVIAYRVRVDATNLATDPCQMIVVPTEFSTTIASINAAREQYMARFKTLSPTGEGQTVGVIQMPWINCAQFKGEKGMKYDKDFTAAFGANPVQDVYFKVGVANQAGAANLNMEFTVTIEYKVQLYDRNILSSS